MNRNVNPASDYPQPFSMHQVTVERRLSSATRFSQFQNDTQKGLSYDPPFLFPKWCYDETGSALFEAITRLPEYYLTRSELSIISRHAHHLAAVSQAELVMELGSGSSRKTRTILMALRDAGYLSRFVPLDVDEATLSQASDDVARDYPGVNVQAIVGDYEHNVSPIPQSAGRRLVLFLGSTIGNLRPIERRNFLDTLCEAMTEQDMLLLGVDLVKSPDRLMAAYNDSAGINAAFALNALSVINRGLSGNFSLDAFHHYATWNGPAEQMEMYLEATVSQRIHIRDIDLTLELSCGDRIQTEISAKFRMESIGADLEQFGFRINEWWTDNHRDYAVILAAKKPV